MVTRKSFLDWINPLPISKECNINSAKFLNIEEKSYLFKILENIRNKEKNSEVLEKIEDFINIEKQRYHLIENYTVEESIAIEQINRAIIFCQLDSKQKRKTYFKINAEINNYLIKSKFLWDSKDYKTNSQIAINYLMFPGFLKTAPKEICLLNNFNSLLLDLKDYKESFTYESLLELVVKEMQVKSATIDFQLMEFVMNQTLYYRTFLVEK